MKNMKKKASKKIPTLPAKISPPSPHVLHVPPVQISPSKILNNLVVY
jgi:hypothetical protein